MATFKFSKASIGNGITKYSNFAVPTPSAGVSTLSVDFLVIAGGGGGAVRSGNAGGAGGGGAGGYATSTGTSGANSSAKNPVECVLGTGYTVTIGAGGASVSNGNIMGNNGSPSIFANISTAGGGGGSNGAPTAAKSGGSGGGTSNVYRGYGKGTDNQGSNGGYCPAPYNGSGGGGGAGGAGGNSSSDSGGTGGSGLASSITGSSITRAGGGGGGAYVNGSGGSGSAGGGSGTYQGTGGNGTANYGSGGGGTGSSSAGNYTGGGGGSGLVVLKFADTYTLTVGSGLTSSNTSSGGYKIYTFTAGTGTVTFS